MNKTSPKRKNGNRNISGEELETKEPYRRRDRNKNITDEELGRSYRKKWWLRRGSHLIWGGGVQMDSARR